MKTWDIRRSVALALTVTLAGSCVAMARQAAAPPAPPAPAGSQPAIQAVRPEDVPEAVRRQHEEQMRRRAEQQANPVAATPTPAAAAPAAPVERPIPAIISTDSTVKMVISRLTGMKYAEAVGDRAALSLGAGVVTVKGLDNAVYFEVARADDPARPFRSGIWHVFMRRGQPVIRQFDVRTGGNATSAFAGFWAAPQALPVFDLASLGVALEMPLTISGESVTAATANPFPSTAMGATEVTSTWTLNADGLTFDDRGFDAAGNQVFGSGPVTFKPLDAAKGPKVNIMPTGTIVVDLVPPAPGEGLVAGGEAAVHYSGWLASGVSFGTSREPNPRTGNVEPFRFTHGNVIPGFNDGVIGINRGAVRRIFVPAAQGYGARARGAIPANSDLYFLVETLWHQAPQPKVEATPAAPVAPVTPAVAPTGTPGGAAGSTQPQIKAVPSDQVPAHIREAHEKEMKRRAEEAAKKAAEGAKPTDTPAEKPADPK
ncbi:MAG: CpcT/CpeT family chromophore lyase [Phycisphaerales bacterium]|nr:CpcT/CpeT family chromophore lyase [Phycisphaerales bacterium]